MFAEVKAIYSGDLIKPHTPDNPECCTVLMHADIGLKNSNGSDTFSFSVVTPSWMVTHPETRWGSGYLLIPEFSWSEIERMVTRLVSSTSGESWADIARILGRYMSWEYENYQARK